MLKHCGEENASFKGSMDLVAALVRGRTPPVPHTRQHKRPRTRKAAPAGCGEALWETLERPRGARGHYYRDLIMTCLSVGGHAHHSWRLFSTAIFAGVL